MKPQQIPLTLPKLPFSNAYFNSSEKSSNRSCMSRMNVVVYNGHGDDPISARLKSSINNSAMKSNDAQVSEGTSDDFVILSDLRCTISRLKKEVLEVVARFNELLDDHKINVENIQMIEDHQKEFIDYLRRRNNQK